MSEGQNPLDKQVGGSHYQRFKIQPLEFAEANRLDFATGNVIKYVLRAEFKNGLEDIEKAEQYLSVIAQRHLSDSATNVNPIDFRVPEEFRISVDDFVEDNRLDYTTAMVIISVLSAPNNGRLDHLSAAKRGIETLKKRYTTKQE